MTRLWDKGAPLDERVLRYTAGEDHALDNRLVAYDVQASIAHAEMLHDAGLWSTTPTSPRSATACSEIAAAHARGEWSVTLDLEDGQTALETLLTRADRRGGRAPARRPLAQRPGARRAAALPARRRRGSRGGRARASPTALEGLAPRRRAHIALPGYTHMQQAMPSSVALWARGFAAEIRDDADGLRHAHRRILKNPLGSAAGYGTPNLPVDRDGTRTRARVPREPRAGDGGAALARQGRGRGAVPGGAADAGPRPPRLRPAAVLHARVRLRRRCRTRSRPARRSCRRSATRTCSSWCAGARRRRRPASSRCWASPPSCRRATSATCS